LKRDETARSKTALDRMKSMKTEFGLSEGVDVRSPKFN
jgi:hypothetical protein